jgi:hypothetical protein
VDHGRMTRIARGAMVELTTEIDDLHDWSCLKVETSPDGSYATPEGTIVAGKF